jgi:catechol 2,3-dioxygenase-like lactoylglutathione lyase family enzyme
MALLAVDHIQLAMPVGAEDEARRFYVGGLGLSEVPKPADLAVRGGCWFERGALKLHLSVDPNFIPARRAHPAFIVSDLAGMIGALEQGAYRLSDDVPIEGYVRRFVEDPFGNRIELMEPVGV